MKRYLLSMAVVAALATPILADYLVIRINLGAEATEVASENQPPLGGGIMGGRGGQLGMGGGRGGLPGAGGGGAAAGGAMGLGGGGGRGGPPAFGGGGSDIGTGGGAAAGGAMGLGGGRGLPGASQGSCHSSGSSSQHSNKSCCGCHRAVPAVTWFQYLPHTGMPCCSEARSGERIS